MVQLPMLGALLLAGMLPLRSAEAQIVVVVNRENSRESLSLPDLRDLYLGALTHFKGGERVVLLESSGLRPRFYDAVLNMSEDRVKRHWIGLVFSGEGVLPPREFRESADLVRYVASHPGAIGFVPLAVTDSTVKVLMVEGLAPSDPRYPIR